MCSTASPRSTTLGTPPTAPKCGVSPRHVLPISEQWHQLLMRALSSIPDVQAGDSVWWHCDVIHAVAPVQDQLEWGNVMYMPAAGSVRRNSTPPAGADPGRRHGRVSLERDWAASASGNGPVTRQTSAECVVTRSARAPRRR
ncbi:YbiU family protein [Arthrobacter sp. 9MFCol3.1]|uniref:YbiU family protein n=1 Tax=Arthrobacter sp. 9MFCol3.1 TaxID=1150398 RepID=UPI0022B07682|nr:YbiU family protein [Arthrobacter sp. 9MFCol3.1]